MEKTRYIGGCLNTEPDKVKDYLKELGFKFHLIIDINKEVTSKEKQKEKKIVYGFTSSEGLVKNIENCYHPPILWESASVLKNIKLNQKIILLDSSILLNGIILFHNLDTKVLSKLVNTEFNFEGQIKYEKTKVVQFGNNSKLSMLLNCFLATLPVVTHEPTLVAFATAFEKCKFKMLNKYILDNRLITNENKKEYEALSVYLTKIKDDIKHYVKEGKISKKEDVKLSLARVKFLIKYYGTKKIMDYLDNENNVQVENNK